MKNQTTNKGYVTYVNVNSYDYLDNQTTIEFNESDNINDLNDLIQLIIDSDYNNIYNQVYSMKINDVYYLEGYDKAISIINQIINGKMN